MRIIMGMMRMPLGMFPHSTERARQGLGAGGLFVDPT